MKMWQMIKELTENPGKRFESDDYEAYVDDGLLEVTFVAKVTDFSIFLDREWEEVKEPVTWQEAFEASINGKRITVEYENKTYEQESFLKIGCLSLDKTGSYGFDRKMFTEGKWYIED